MEKPKESQKRTFWHFHEWSLKIGHVLYQSIKTYLINLMELSNLLFYELIFTAFPPGLNAGIIETKQIKEKSGRLVCIFQFCIWMSLGYIFYHIYNHALGRPNVLSSQFWLHFIHKICFFFFNSRYRLLKFPAT